MVNQKWIAVSYCLSFIFVYLCFIFYSIFPLLMEKIGININFPQTQATAEVANVTTGIAGFANMESMSSIIIVIVFIFVLVIIIHNIERSMASGI